MTKLSNKKLDEIRASYRKFYKCDLFFTEDGNCFLKKNMAEAYARKEKLKVIEDLVEKPKPITEDVEMTEDDAKEALKGIELNKDADYDLLGDIVKALALETEGKSKDAYIKALLPVQEDLKD